MRQRRSAVAFVGALGAVCVLGTLALAALRVGGLINWSWRWVLAPLLGFWGATLAGVLVAYVVIERP